MAETYSDGAPYKVICCAGSLIFNNRIKRHVPRRYPGPDQLLGHINHLDGNTIYVAPKPLDDIPTPYTIIEESAVPSNRTDMGQYSRAIKSVTTPVQHVQESPTSSDSTARLWRGKTFGGRIKF
jgi:hypothetical protein